VGGWEFKNYFCCCFCLARNELLIGCSIQVHPSWLGDFQPQGRSFGVFGVILLWDVLSLNCAQMFIVCGQVWIGWQLARGLGQALIVALLLHHFLATTI